MSGDTMSVNNREHQPSHLSRLFTSFSALIALICLAGRIFWFAARQFGACDLLIWNQPQPGYCGVVSELNWIIYYGPVVSIAISFAVLVLRPQRWYSSPRIPLLVFGLSALLLVPTFFGMFLRAFLGGMH